MRHERTCVDLPLDECHDLGCNARQRACRADYCTSLYEDCETERCWLAYQYFEEKKVRQ